MGEPGVDMGSARRIRSLLHPVSPQARRGARHDVRATSAVPSHHVEGTQRKPSQTVDCQLREHSSRLSGLVLEPKTRA